MPKKIVLTNFPAEVYVNADGSPKPLRWIVRAYNAGFCCVCEKESAVFDISSSLDPNCYINRVCEPCFRPFNQALIEAIASVGSRVVRIDSVPRIQLEVTQASRGQVKQSRTQHTFVGHGRVSTPTREEMMTNAGFSDPYAFGLWLSDMAEKAIIAETNSHRRRVGAVM